MLDETNRHLIDRNWKPIIPFELKNVHFCSTYGIAQKLSMSGAKVKHFLERPEKIKYSAKSWELWKDLCNCTTFDYSEPSLVVTRGESLVFIQ